MKDLMVIWNSLSRRQSYSPANITPNSDWPGEQDAEVKRPRSSSSLGRKSSVVVNRFFNAALPVHTDGRRKWSKNIFILMSVGLLGLALGCIILVCQPYENIFKFKAIFSDGGEIFEIWKKPNIDLYLKVYLFNITNSDEFLEGRESKLRFQQVGPYVYKEHFVHTDIIFNNNGTLSSVPKYPLEYIPEMSNGTLDDLLILPNIALLAIANLMKDASYISRWGLNMLIRQTKSKPLVQMTAHEFMFGYESTLLTLGNHLMPSWLNFHKLGLIDRMYNFNDFETFYTGETDIRLTGLIEKYNGHTNLPHWSGKCANVQGASDGIKFSSYIQPNDTLLFFRKSLCRSERMVRIGEKVINGLNTYHYIFMQNELDNGAVNPENKCFCRQGYCLKPGLIDVTDCYYGFPIALSYPHFYQSDPSLLEAVEGLEPKKDIHESYFFIQPKSGLPVKLSFRFQINMALQDISKISQVEKFSNFTLPMLWFEIAMYDLPYNLHMRFFLYINVLPVVEEVLIYLLFLSGAILLIWSVVNILSYQGKESPMNWLETEMERRRQRAKKDKVTDGKEREMDAYNSFLVPDNANAPMSV